MIEWRVDNRMEIFYQIQKNQYPILIERKLYKKFMLNFSTGRDEYFFLLDIQVSCVYENVVISVCV